MAASLARLTTTATRYLLRNPGPTLSLARASSWNHSPALFSRPQTYSYSYSYSTTAPALNDTEAELSDSFEFKDEGNKKGSDSSATHFQTLESKIHANTLRAITKGPFNISHMSPVQSKVLPLLPKLAMPYNAEDSGPRDLLVKAKTGTGKTLAFLVPAIEARIRTLDNFVQMALNNAGLTSDRMLEARTRRSIAEKRAGTLVISPTRELATQIANEALKLSAHHEGFEVKLLVGGESRRAQIKEWDRGRKDLVVATPGRLRDLVREPQFASALKYTQMLILDEADSLLDMGFRDDIDDIVSHLPPAPERQTFLFSATVSSAIKEIAEEVMDRNHKFINCVTEDDAPVHTAVQQYHTVLPSGAQQSAHIVRLLAHEQLTNPGSSKTIIFLPTTKMTQLYASLLREMKSSLPAGKNTTIYEIHSKRTMEARRKTSADFRADRSGCAVLVSSDVSARGVDYPGVTRVIQVGIPPTTTQYVHRVGRTGRAGEGGRQGRGDLVLLPWERDFVTWELKTMPLKPVTVTELERQVNELAEKLDEDPQGYFDNFGSKLDDRAQASPQRPLKGFGVVARRSVSPIDPKQFTSPYSPVAKGIDVQAENIREQMNDDDVATTFMSLVGFYVSRTTELRMDRESILEACKDWAVKAGGMRSLPHVSPSMLQRLGISSSSSFRKFGMDRPQGFGQQRSGGGWRDGSRSSYGGGIDRSRAQEDWRSRERYVERLEGNSRAGQSWLRRDRDGRSRRDDF